VERGQGKQKEGDRILVTGGAGFIGANLVRMLLDRGCQVTVLDNLSQNTTRYLEKLPIELVKGDVLDAELVSELVSGKDGVVHLAGQTGVQGSIANPRRDCEINVLGTLNLLEACRREKEKRETARDAVKDSVKDTFSGPRFVFASSNAPLGRQVPPASEDKAPLPISPYGASKLACEAYCLAYQGSWGLGTVVLRFSNVYGPFSLHKNSVVAKFFKDILNEGQITLDGDGGQTRDFIYVEDLCRAILLALDSNASGEVFQIATGVETTIQGLAELVQKAIGKAIGVSHGPGRQGDIQKNYSNVSKAEKTLGWRPQVPLAIGLKQTWAWFELQ